jgi:hypothetical protein
MHGFDKEFIKKYLYLVYIKLHIPMLDNLLPTPGQFLPYGSYPNNNFDVTDENNQNPVNLYTMVGYIGDVIDGLTCNANEQQPFNIEIMYDEYGIIQTGDVSFNYTDIYTAISIFDFDVYLSYFATESTNGLDAISLDFIRDNYWNILMTLLP